MNMIVVGPTGCGKSTFTREFIEELEKLIVIFDSSKAYQDSLEYTFGSEKTKSFTVTAENYSRVDFKKIFDHAAKNDMITLFDVGELDSHQTASFLDRYARLVMEKYSRITTIVEEAFRLLPRTQPTSSEFKHLMRAGRKKGLDTILVFQQVSDSALEALRECHYAVVFKVQDINEFKKLSRIVDANVFDDLNQHGYVFVNTRSGEFNIIN